MGKSVALGGDRLGSGKKRDLELHNYYRSTHNLSRDFASSMAPGILYPFMCIPALRGDKFQIDLEAAARTIPTQGPLFGSFKMQLDVFQCPIRLYQALLHNNPLAIGLKMNQVKLPTIEFTQGYTSENTGELDELGKFSSSSLAAYLGIRGIGKPIGNYSEYTGQQFKRVFNAVPFLAYYDIFKNYYANKQEEKAYVITTKTTTLINPPEINSIQGKNVTTGAPLNYYDFDHTVFDGNIGFSCSGLAEIELQFDSNNLDELYDNLIIGGIDVNDDEYSNSVKELINEGLIVNIKESNKHYWVNINMYALMDFWESAGIKAITIYTVLSRQYIQENFILQDFKLSNIDDMRYEILSYAQLGTPFKLNTSTSFGNYPYRALDSVGGIRGYDNLNKFSHNGLVVKTYQSDLFNNWVDTEWISGANGISAITAVTTDANGKFTIDALNLQEKLYNMLNRVAVSGGTYEDWQDAVYETVQRRQIESPIYCGGMSTEIVFEEIVQTAPAGEGDNATELGTLGGRGTLVKRKGGNVTIKCDEASFIIGLVSITPRLYYTQGNEFYMTDIFSLDDLHKPALDGIGFQDLITEQMVCTDAEILANGTITRHSAGKVPAWSNYMTAVDQAYGDFAMQQGKSYMILSRDYTTVNGRLRDATTYIDPRKFNYAFAYTELDAQNFWVQIRSTIKARRLMSAKQIPNI